MRFAHNETDIAYVSTDEMGRYWCQTRRLETCHWNKRITMRYRGRSGMQFIKTNRPRRYAIALRGRFDY